MNLQKNAAFQAFGLCSTERQQSVVEGESLHICSKNTISLSVGLQADIILLLPIIFPSVQRSTSNSIRAQSATLQPFHLAFPVRDVSEAKDFYGAKLGLQEGRSAKSWVDYSLFGHQIVCHHIQGYNATNTANAGIYGHILQQCLNFYSWK